MCTAALSSKNTQKMILQVLKDSFACRNNWLFFQKYEPFLVYILAAFRFKATFVPLFEFIFTSITIWIFFLDCTISCFRAKNYQFFHSFCGEESSCLWPSSVVITSTFVSKNLAHIFWWKCQFFWNFIWFYDAIIRNVYIFVSKENCAQNQ